MTNIHPAAAAIAARAWHLGARAALCLGLNTGLAASVLAAPPGPCGATALGTAQDLVQCIRREPLMDHLVALQQISDDHPGPDGHGRRETFTAGYRASVDYVAALVRQAGYAVTVQAYPSRMFEVEGTPRLQAGPLRFTPGRDWHVARLSGSGTVRAPVHRVGEHGQQGCAAADFAGFPAGHVALVERAACELDEQVALAEAAHAGALVIVRSASDAARRGKGEGPPGEAFEAHLTREASLPVIGVASHAVGLALQAHASSAPGASVEIEVHAHTRPGTDYNLIAESPYGDAASVVVVEGHLDSIYGAGILDNASGSSTLLEIALAMAHTPTRHRLRYIWFGGEEIGLFGSAWYTRTLSAEERAKIVYDIDADVTATPNYAVLVADPGHAHNADRFPPNVVPQSQRGNQYFADYFASIGVPSRPARFGNDGTDSNSFSLVGIPNTGILTQQDCCKTVSEVKAWGGWPGNYEGRVPGRDGGCVDWKGRWCDDIGNVDPQVLEFVSRSVAYVTWQLANDPGIAAAR